MHLYYLLYFLLYNINEFCNIIFGKKYFLSFCFEIKKQEINFQKLCENVGRGIVPSDRVISSLPGEFQIFEFFFLKILVAEFMVELGTNEFQFRW